MFFSLHVFCRIWHVRRWSFKKDLQHSIVDKAARVRTTGYRYINITSNYSYIYIIYISGQIIIIRRSLGRISYFQMEISLGRWNMKLFFVGRRSYPCLNQRRRIDNKSQDYSEQMKAVIWCINRIQSNTLPGPAGNRACRDFSQDVQFDSFGSQKLRIGRLEKKNIGSICSS